MGIKVTRSVAMFWSDRILFTFWFRYRRWWRKPFRWQPASDVWVDASLGPVSLCIFREVQ